MTSLSRFAIDDNEDNIEFKQLQWYFLDVEECVWYQCFKGRLMMILVMLKI